MMHSAIASPVGCRCQSLPNIFTNNFVYSGGFKLLFLPKNQAKVGQPKWDTIFL